MSRILLADDSPHAQRMGERILRGEGYEVVAVSDGDTALMRLADVDPDVILADVYLPGKSGYEICEQVRANPRWRHTRVVLTAGLLEHIDDDWAARCGSDLVLKKPFEPSALIAAIEPLVAAAEAVRAAEAAPEAAAENPPASPETAPVITLEPAARIAGGGPSPVTIEETVQPVSEVETVPDGPAAPAAPAPEPYAPPAVPDAERIRAAVTIALDRAMPALIDELTERVLIALGH
ncbi:MAG: response regulator [bacterium]